MIARKRLLLALSMLVNVLVPWAVYRLTVARLGETHAIMATAVVPAMWSFAEFARNRKVDVMSALCSAGSRSRSPCSRWAARPKFSCSVNP